MGGGGDLPNSWQGSWGSFRTLPQKGIVTYGLAPNRLRPFAGALHAAFFNTFRRTKAQILYVVPPFVVAYAVMQWAVERNHFLNSKHGRAEAGDDE